MKERLPWFRCFPSALLGAMAGMTPEEGYTYVAVLLRIYETGGPVAETTRTLSRRTGLTERKVREALESLISAGKVRQGEDGRLDSDSTHDELAWQSQCRENNSKAGKSSAAKRAGKAQQNQQPAATRVQQSRNHIDEEKEHITPSDEGVAPQPKPTPRSELETVLDAERADAVLEHRQRIGSPLTVRAAKLLARKLAEWPGGANEAADAMIEAGWRGFEVAWLENRKVPQNGRGPPGRKSMSEQLSDFTRMSDEELFDDPPRSDASNAQGAGPDLGHAVRGVSERTWRSQEQIPWLSRCVGR